MDVLLKLRRSIVWVGAPAASGACWRAPSSPTLGGALRSAVATRRLTAAFGLAAGLTLALLSVPAQAQSRSPSYIAAVWQTEQGLPQNTVNAIAQDAEGYLWLATNAASRVSTACGSKFWASRIFRRSERA
jgi:hypothetical protein